MKMKRKGILLASAILGSVAIVSTGFAAWVITSPSTSTTAQGNIQVETVTDNRVAFKVEFTKELESDSAVDNTVTFGSSTIKSNDTSWLSNPDGTPEDLSVSFKVTAQNSEGENLPISGTLELTKVELGTVNKAGDDDVFTAMTDFETANKYQTQTLIVLPTTGVDYTFSNSATLSSAIELQFAWGTAFAGYNPYVYYNSFKLTDIDTNADDDVHTYVYKSTLEGVNNTYADFDTMANEALAKLQALETLLKDKTFKVTLEYTAATE